MVRIDHSKFTDVTEAKKYMLNRRMSARAHARTRICNKNYKKMVKIKKEYGKTICFVETTME